MTHVFLINLRRQPERLQQMRARLEGIGLPFTVVPAFDAKTEDVKPHIAPIKAFINSGLRRAAKPHVACFVSHRSIWQFMSDNEISSAMILEDDAVPVDWDPRILDLDIAAKGLDFLRLERIEIPDSQRNGRKAEKWLGLQRADKGQTILNRAVRHQPSWGTAAYVITLQGARKCLGAGKYWFHVDHYRMWSICAKLNTAYLDPPMWEQSGESSSTEIPEQPPRLLQRLVAPFRLASRGGFICAYAAFSKLHYH